MRSARGTRLSFGLLLSALAAFPANSTAIDVGAWRALTPPSRALPSIIYDPVGHRLILFGGQLLGAGDDRFLSDAWELTLGDGPVWRRLAPAGAPPTERVGHTAIYDPVGRRMVVFGGTDRFGAGATFFNDVWALSLDGPLQWTELAPGGGPPGARAYHTAVYDEARDRMVVYGGVGALQYADCWELTLDGAPTWTPLPDAPRIRFGHSAIYDPGGDRMLVFGGRDCTGGPCVLDKNDTWELTFAGAPTWNELLPAGLPPASRRYHAVVYDPVRDRMIVDGGETGGFGFYDDTWALSLSGLLEWVEISPAGENPGPRAAAPAIHDPVGDRLVSRVFDETWVFLLSGIPEWTQDLEAGARFAPAVAYDGAGRALLHGGVDPRGTARSDLWEVLLGGSPAWRELDVTGTPPPGRSEHAAVPLPNGNVVIIGGQADGSAPLGDTWILASSSWIPVSGATPPPARWGHAAVFDAPRNRLVMFGGTNGTSWLNDAWALTFGGVPDPNWSPLSTFGTPPDPRSGHSATYIPGSGSLVVFGGHDGTTHYNDVWTLPLEMTTPMWTNVPASGTPPAPRRGHQAIYDAARGRIVIHGGRNSTTTFGDVWQLEVGGPLGAAWAQLAPLDSPPTPRYGHAAIYDTGRDRMVLFGGRREGASDTTNYGDLWSLEWSTTVGAPEADAAPRVRLSAFAPNPTSRGAHLVLDLPGEALVRTRIYDIFGRSVRTLVEQRLPPGRHMIVWDGTDGRGRPSPGGVYVADVVVRGHRFSRKLVLAP